MSVYIGDGKRVSVRIVTDLAPKINEGTAIPRGERVDRIYFNTSLPQDKTNEILSQLTYTSIPGFDEPVNILYAWANENMDGHVIIAMQTELEAEEGRTGHYIIYFNCPFREDASFGTPILFNPRHHSDIIPGNGWYYDLYGENGDWGYINSGSISLLGFTDSGFQAPTEFNGLPIGAENELIKNVLSITPFDSPATADTGVIEVDELPTENVDESAIYRTHSEVVDMVVAVVSGEMKMSSDFNFHLVDELPEPNDSMGMSDAYVLRDSGIGYCYVPEYGMWMSAGQLCEFLIGMALPDKGFITDKEIAAGGLADGVYVHKVPSVTYGIPAATSENEIYELDKSGTWVHADMQVLSAMVEGYDSPLEEIVIPYGVRSIRNSAFENFRKLKKVLLPNTVAHIGLRAFNYSGLVSVTIPPSIETISQNAFDGSGYLEEIILPDKDFTIDTNAFSSTGAYWASIEEDPYNLFYVGPHLLGIETNYVGEVHIKPGTKYIHNGALELASKITALTIPEGVLSIHSWSLHLLDVETLVLPESLEYIGHDIAYARWGSKLRVTIKAKNPPAYNDILFGGTAFDPQYIEALYVPAESVDLYKQDPLFSNIADVILPIEE